MDHIDAPALLRLNHRLWSLENQTLWPSPCLMSRGSDAYLLMEFHRIEQTCQVFKEHKWWHSAYSVYLLSGCVRCSTPVAFSLAASGGFGRQILSLLNGDVYHRTSHRTHLLDKGVRLSSKFLDLYLSPFGFKATGPFELRSCFGSTHFVGAGVGEKLLPSADGVRWGQNCVGSFSKPQTSLNPVFSPN